MGVSFFLFRLPRKQLQSSNHPVLLTLRREYIPMSGDEEGLIASCDGQFHVSF